MSNLIYKKMKKISLEEMSHIYGGKFIGSETSATPCIGGTRVVHRDFYLFGIKIHQSTMTEPC